MSDGITLALAIGALYLLTRKTEEPPVEPSPSVIEKPCPDGTKLIGGNCVRVFLDVSQEQAPAPVIVEEKKVTMVEGVPSCFDYPESRSERIVIGGI